MKTLTMNEALLVAVLAAGLCRSAQASEIDARQTQLFIDDEIIESSTLLQRVVHQPIRYSMNPLLSPEEPWEGSGLNYFGGVYRDEKTGLFRAWYVGTVAGNVPGMPKVYFPVCLITSQDGIRWTRPKLMVNSHLTGGPNNIVLHLESGCIAAPNILHTPEDARRPWKLIIHHSPTTPCRYNVRMASSADGVHWQWETEGGFHAGFHDRLTAMFDPASKDAPYLLFSRPGAAARNYPLLYADRVRTREVYQARLAADGRSLATTPRLTVRPDLEDDPFAEIYHMSAFRYESLYLGYLLLYRSNESPSAEVQLITSRDAVNWQRPRPRTPFIPSLLPEGRKTGQWDAGGAQTTLSGPIAHHGALWIYYYGHPAFHDNRHLKGEGRLGVARLRMDGFASLRANWREGYVTTKPFIWPGGKLRVNCEILGGNGTREDAWVRVAILDEGGRPLPGLSRVESDAIVTDVVAGEPTWSGRSQDLQHLAGKRIRLRFFLREAEIYSFRVDKESPQQRGLK